jgi:putative membrane protein
VFRVIALLAVAAAIGCAATADSPAARAPLAWGADTTTAATSADAVVAAKVTVEPSELPRREPSFTDDQIVSILATFNEGEVHLAKIAHERGKDARVRTFADALVHDHGAALRQELHLRDPRIARTPTEQERRMARATEDEAKKLEALEGHELDVEFVANQVDAQRDALALIDVQLVPSVHHADVRAHLADFRGTVDRHLHDAQALARALGGPIIARR